MWSVKKQGLSVFGPSKTGNAALKSLLATYQTDVGVKTFLDVLPVEFDATSSDPQKDDAGEDQLSEGPTNSCNQNLKQEHDNLQQANYSGGSNTLDAKRT